MTCKWCGGEINYIDKFKYWVHRMTGLWCSDGLHRAEPND